MSVGFIYTLITLSSHFGWATHEICGEPSTEYSSWQPQCSRGMDRGSGNIAQDSYAVVSSSIGDHCTRRVIRKSEVWHIPYSFRDVQDVLLASVEDWVEGILQLYISCDWQNEFQLMNVNFENFSTLIWGPNKGYFSAATKTDKICMHIQFWRNSII